MPPRSMRSKFEARVPSSKISIKEVLYNAFGVGYCGETNLHKFKKNLNANIPLASLVDVKFQEEPTIEISLSQHLYFRSYSSRSIQ